MDRPKKGSVKNQNIMINIQYTFCFIAYYGHFVSSYMYKIYMLLTISEFTTIQKLVDKKLSLGI